MRRRLPSGVVAIVGAGPHGLATAAHLRGAGVETVVFGRPLEFWRRGMPSGMLLRSRKRSSSIADPARSYTLDAWAAATGRALPNPIPLADFLDYGEWFRRRAVGDVDSRLVRRIEANHGFHLTLDDGAELEASRVVVAAGLSPFPRVPPPFDGLPDGLVSHTSHHADFERFAGRRVLVVGAGQSALESAALLHEVGAEAEVVARTPAVRWLPDASVARKPTLAERMLPPTDVGGRVTGWIAAAPDAYRKLPTRLRPGLTYRCIAPAGSGWLLRRLADVPILPGTTVVAAAADDGRARLALSGGDERVVDHVLLGTGFEVDVRRYGFLGPELLGRLEIQSGHPVLHRGLESSVPGLHFVGAPAARSFGPVMRFVVGSWYAAPAVCRRVLDRRQPPLRFSF